MPESTTQEKISIFLVAGEASADMHGAALVREIHRLHPSASFYGVGGERLQGEGMELIVHARSLNVVGIADWWDKAGEVLRSYRLLKRVVRERRPDCAILLDLPDFNLRMARHLKALGVSVIYYISPQVWAWRKSRIKKIKKYVDEMMVVFHFEKPFYEKHGVEVTFVGHPLLETLRARAEYRLGVDVRRAPRVALLPGSRPSELKYHAPILKTVVEKLRANYPASVFRVPVASTLAPDAVREALADPSLELIEGRSEEVLRWADVAVVASGTATLETALIGTPFCLYYRVSASSAWIYNHLARYRGFIGMPNLLQEREVVREFFQDRASDLNIAGEVIRLIEDDGARNEQAAALRSCRDKLGQSGASALAAARVNYVLRRPAHDRGVALETAPLS